VRVDVCRVCAGGGSLSGAAQGVYVLPGDGVCGVFVHAVRDGVGGVHDFGVEPGVGEENVSAGEDLTAKTPRTEPQWHRGTCVWPPERGGFNH